ncbi:MAG: hypothetical protein ABJC09_11840 [Terriglobia bacterium]
MKRSQALSIAAITVASAAAWAVRDDAANYPYVPYDHAAIRYEIDGSDNPIARLQTKLDRGQVRLGFDPKWGYLPALLKQLDVNTDSQMLVFSKTSFQGPRISPRKPRALYFNDNVAVGFVQDGDLMEFTTLDSRQGIVFYTMKRNRTIKPVFNRRVQECLNCHVFPGTLYVPGLVASSVIPGPDGAPRFVAAATIVDSRTPLEQRWGGWYVTGTSGALQHRGNSVSPDAAKPSELDLTNNQNLTSLAGRFDTTDYLAGGSDLVALLTLEHQTRMTNLLIRLGWEARIAQQEGKLAQFSDRLTFLTDELVSYMLFVEEAPIHSPIKGVSSFTTTFPARGPRDRQGRSLRDFDLQKRLFRYPLSYMIYNAAFDALPAVAKERTYQKLFDVLTDRDQGERYSRLTPVDRKAILEILRDTKPALPGYWRTAAER